MNFIEILGIKISNLSKKEALDKVANFLQDNEQHKIYTPNPEMLVDANLDENFRKVLNKGDLNICDGFGLQLVSWFRLKRIPGTDFMLDICKLAEEQGRGVYFLGSGSEETLQKLVTEIRQKFPDLKIAGSHPGNKLQVISYKLQLDREENDQLIADITMSSPDILFVAFGHGKQEKWIDKYLPELPGVKVAMGVGGAFDFIAGKVKRAPRLMRKIGLEWLYRLIREPRRFKRIWKATFVFIYYAIRKK